MKKKLPVVMNPIIKCRTPYANLMSIAAQHEKCNEWVIEAFVQIMSWSENDLRVDLMFHPFPDTRHTMTIHTLSARNSVCPFLKIHTQPYDEPQEWDISAADYLKRLIDRNYYVYMALDKSQHNPYVKHFFPHEGLIYGYDDSAESFYMLDYQTGYYRSFEITYDTVIKSHREVLTQREAGDIAAFNYSDLGITKIKYLPDADFSCDISSMKRHLIDYLAGDEVDAEYRKFYPNHCYRFGISYYRRMIHAWENYVKTGCDEARTPIDFSLLKEHKNVMKLRFDFLYSNGHITEHQYSTLLELFQNIPPLCDLNEKLFLKYDFSQNTDYLSRIVENLAIIEHDEKKMLEYLISVI